MSGPVTHGVFVKSKNGKRLRDIAVRRLTRTVRVAMPWLENSDMAVVRAWAEMELLAVRMYAELKAKGLLNVQGEAKRLVNDYRAMRQTQLGFARELGMTPASRQALQANSTNVAVDLAARMANDDETNDEVNDDG